jgi:hypothetical protein
MKLEGRPTLQGLTVGTVRVGGRVRRRDVAVWGKEFPSWLPCLDALGLHVTMVFVERDGGLAMIQRFVDEECQILVLGHIGNLIELVRPMVEDVDTLLIDGGPAGEAMVLAEGLGFKHIVSTRMSRRIPKGWQQSLVVDHTEIGGVTNTILRMSRLHKGPASDERLRIDRAAPRDVSTILNVKSNRVVFLDAPKDVAVTPLGVINLAETGAVPYYHGGGLLPARVNRSTRVLTPSIYASAGKWGRRALSHEEVLKPKDLTSEDIRRLEGFGLTNEFYEALAPVKCLAAGYQALMNGGGVKSWA